MKKSTIVEIIIDLYIILFLYTGISKLQDYSVFKEQLVMSPVLSVFAKPIAMGLPIFEFLVIVMLIIPRWRLKGLYTALVLMTLFTIYIIIMMTFFEQLPCSCGGIISEMSWPQHIIFNSAFILLALVGIRLQSTIKKESRKNLVLAQIL